MNNFINWTFDNTVRKIKYMYVLIFNMAISLTELRTQLYKLIDHVIETGKPLEIERKGHKIKIILEDTKMSKLNLLKRRVHIIKDENLNDTPWEWDGNDFS